MFDILRKSAGGGGRGLEGGEMPNVKQLERKKKRKEKKSSLHSFNVVVLFELNIKCNL